MGKRRKAYIVFFGGFGRRILFSRLRRRWKYNIVF
jgi:hypothetical protein